MYPGSVGGMTGEVICGVSQVRLFGLEPVSSGKLWSEWCIIAAAIADCVGAGDFVRRVWM